MIETTSNSTFLTKMCCCEYLHSGHMIYALTACAVPLPEGKTSYDQLTIEQAVPMYENLALKLMEDSRGNAQPLTAWDVYNMYVDLDIKAPDALKLSRSQMYELKDQMAILKSPVQPPVEDTDVDPVFFSPDLGFLTMPAIAMDLFPANIPPADAISPAPEASKAPKPTKATKAAKAEAARVAAAASEVAAAAEVAAAIAASADDGI